MPLYEAMNLRKSQRVFDPTSSLTDEQISMFLWACVGVNRPETKGRTTPSAVAWYPYDVYVFKKEGIYKYDPIEHEMNLVMEGDYRSVTGTQPFVKNAAVNFVLISDLEKPTILKDLTEKKKYSYLDSGHCTMSMSLYAAALKMKGVVRGMFKAQEILDLLKLDKERYLVIISYSVGN